MAGRGPAPKSDRRRVNAPARGEWATAEPGWQHGEIPDPPDGLLEASRVAWVTWMESWFAGHWLPADLPALRQVIRLYDQVERGEFQRSAELRMSMDTYGISPKGQQDRRWAPPAEAEGEPVSRIGSAKERRLRAVAGE